MSGIRYLPDTAPEPVGTRIPYTCPEGMKRMVVYVETVISNARGPLVWWRENFYETTTVPPLAAEAVLEGMK